MRRFGYRVVADHDWAGAYIDPKQTIAAAGAAGMTVQQYVASLWGDADTVAASMQRLRAAIPAGNCERVLEIGPGTGRFLGPMRELFRPVHIEIYEPVQGWADYLVSAFRVEKRPANGYDLSSTPSASCDLAVAHGVFVYAPAVVSFRYFTEMCRVVRPGGYIAFDVFPDDKTTADVIDRWLAARDSFFQVVVPRAALLDTIAMHGARQVAEFEGGVPTGFRQESFSTTYLVFRKDS